MNNFRQPLLASMMLAATASLAGIAAVETASAQVVSDRTLSDVRVNHLGSCAALAITFNIRFQMLSYFPTTSGRELHVRIRPLDGTGTNGVRESLRTPETVPELRSIEYEGDNPSGPVLSLFFNQDMRFDIAPGAEPQTLIVRLDKPGAAPICSPGIQAGTTQGTASGTSSAPQIAIPSGLYALNLVSKPDMVTNLNPAQKSVVADKIVYETLYERDSQTWHRLRVGFFDTKDQAEAMLTKLLPLFPEAWVVRVSAVERAQGVSTRINSDMVVTKAPTSSTPATAEEVTQTAKLIDDAEQSISGGNVDRAVQLLTNALTIPENDYTPRALELLGLTRERKGQSAQAQAEYEEYLRRYPTGDASDRVRQRLAALAPSSSTAAPTPQLRAASSESRSASAWSWGARGSFSQFYYRDQSTTKFVDASKPTNDPDVNNNVNLNQLLSTGDITLSGGNDRRQLQLRAAGAYTKNFRQGGDDVKAITALYLDYSDSNLDSTLRIGRQTRNSAGVLGRFDGVLYGWQAKPKMRFNIVGGFPVLTSRQTYVLKERYFYGASFDFGGKRSPFQTSLYWFDQHSRGGFIDRRSVGIETRVLRKRFNAYAMVDYDVKYSKLNLGLLTLNYNFPDNSNFSVTADYRQSPLLTTNNALIGQIDAVTFLPITDLRGLRPFFTDAQIYQLAQDRTLVAKSLTASYSRPLSQKLQANIDVAVTDTGGTPGTAASSGTQAVIALPATGREYYYGGQLIGSGMFWDSDIYILSGRYSDTQRSHTYTADVNARVPITSKLRLSPRVRYGIRKDKIGPTVPIPGDFRQLQPTMRLNYYPIRHSEIEIEVGGNWSRQRDYTGGIPTTFREKGYVLSAGYRIDF